jgi:hypothetical protein
MKNFTAQIIAKLSFITIIVTAFGIIINNIYIGQFNISDFNILQSRSVFIGFIFSIFLLAHLIYYLALIDTKNILNNTYFEIVYKTLLKLILVSNFLFFTLNMDTISSFVKESSTTERVFIQLGYYSFLLIIVLYGTNYSIYKTDTKHKGAILTFKYPLMFFILISCVSFVFYFLSFPGFKTIFFYESYFAFLFLINLTWIYASRKDESKGITFMDISYFSNSSRDKENWLEKILVFTYVIGMTLIFLHSYSTKIYPLLDVKYGGGEPKKIKLEYLDKKIEGELIYHDGQNYYILKDSVILFIKKEEVDMVYLDKMQLLINNLGQMGDSAKIENE